MKNKIIFKTLMLKGEAGSTIVSMEKTGHVGTADIYTITFNDGSTTEISLENMSAITSVEKTSSTDTEDIYTITCADGSTQTFSVLNHNADIAAMSDDIDTIDARVDNFINSVVPNTVETLWTGSIKDVGDSATLSKAVSNFDYIDLYLLGSTDSKYIRVPATQTAVQIQQQNLSDDASSNFLRLWEMGVSISGSTVSITKSIAWAWDDPNNSNPTVTANAQNGDPITRIDGVKVASDTPAELVDIRVGANGTTYASAGAAVRGQLSEITEATRNLNTSNMGRWGNAADGKIYSRNDTYYGMESFVPITAGQTYYVSFGGITSSSVISWTYLFVNDSGTNLARAGYSNIDGHAITAPSGATKLHIFCRSDNTITISDDAYIQIENSTYASKHIDPISASDKKSRERLDVLASNEADLVAAIVDVANSYFSVCYDPNDALVYDSTHGLFTDLYATSQGKEGKKSIVCSQFVQACLSAIPYNYSRYVYGKAHPNHSLWWGWKSDGTGIYYNPTENPDDELANLYAKDYMRASELEEYFGRKGVLHPFNIDHNDMKPGDVIFWKASAFDDTVSSEDDYTSHVAICLNVYENTFTFMHSNNDHIRLCDDVSEAGLMITHWLYSKYTPCSYVHIADIIKCVPYHASNRIYDKQYDFSGTIPSGSASAYIGSIPIKLEKGF
ncbi:hypothetical protein, partial [Clostridioides difficile]|uniref:hypothetical protein n=1 Tax=Clostridioides difficile TaxID=1496 RepID=UPI002358D543